MANIVTICNHWENVANTDDAIHRALVDVAVPTILPYRLVMVGKWDFINKKYVSENLHQNIILNTYLYFVTLDSSNNKNTKKCNNNYNALFYN